MTLFEFVRQKRGLTKELARLINVKPIAVSRWVLGRRPVPAVHCPAIEKATKGVVTCEELRPDVEWSVLRKKRR
ncbi:transcriptional regulator [Pelistega ratti]|uniref:transcriptional regulator n=1 Tax=Pelistega ratti TaxID=2652177 RepID=UPI00135ABD25|nr:helix-turn-helix domain-containing protein [Pelistega ratti]